MTQTVENLLVYFEKLTEIESEVLLGDRVAGLGEGLLDELVGGEVDPPVVIVVAEGAHREHRAVEVELGQLDRRRRVRRHIGQDGQLFAQQLHRGQRIDAVRELRPQLDAAIGIHCVIDDAVAEQLVVADEDAQVVGGVERGSEEADLVHHAGDASAGDHVAETRVFLQDRLGPTVFQVAVAQLHQLKKKLAEIGLEMVGEHTLEIAASA